MRIVQLLLALVGACGGLACAGPTTPARAWPYVVTLNAGTCVEFMFGLFKKDYTEISPARASRCTSRAARTRRRACSTRSTTRSPPARSGGRRSCPAARRFLARDIGRELSF